MSIDTVSRKEGRTITIRALACVWLIAVVFVSHTYIQSNQDYSKTRIQCVWRNVDRIVVVGDLHGAYDKFVKIMKRTDLIDDQLHWIGGTSHLVQLGDILDRGDRARDIFDLLIRLEEEAKSAGGYVHVLIGNHEEMNLADTAFDNDEYITPQQFISFLSERYIKKQERIFGRRKKKLQRKELSSGFDIMKHWKEVIQQGKNSKKHVGRRSYFRNLNRLYGRWILNHNLVVKINDMIFVHAGIIEQYSTINIEDINRIYRLELDTVRMAVLNEHLPTIPVYDMRFFNNPSGPLWTRAFIRENPDDFGDDVGRILFNLGANHMFIGHSPVSVMGEKGMKLYEGRVWDVDTGISDYYQHRGGYVGALIIEDGQISIWRDGLHTRKKGEFNRVPLSRASIKEDFSL